MTDLTHRQAFDAIGIAAQVLTPQAEYLATFIGLERDMHATLPMTDPTLYRQALNSSSLQQQLKLAKAALAFTLAVQQVKAEIMANPGEAQ